MNFSTSNVEGRRQVAQTLPDFAPAKGVGGPQIPTRPKRQFLGGTPTSPPPFPQTSDGPIAPSAPVYFAQIRATLGVLDRIRRGLSSEFPAVDRRFRAALSGPSRFVVRVRSAFPDGSPCHAYLAVAFRSPARRGENWLRWFAGKPTRARLYPLGECAHASAIERAAAELALLNRAMSAVNRAALSVVALLRADASPAPDEPWIPPLSPNLLPLPPATFPKETVDWAWALAVRIGRLDEALRALVEEYRRDPPDPRVILVHSQDRGFPGGRVRWRILPGDRRPGRLTDRLLRAAGISSDRRQLLAEFERERRRIEARRQRLLGVLARLAARARDASEAFRRFASAGGRPWAPPCNPPPGSPRTA